MSARDEILDAGWELAPGGAGDERPTDDAWRAIGTRATVAQARARLGEPTDGIDEGTWWFRTRFTASPPRATEAVLLRFDGLATLSTVFLNGRELLASRSMHAQHRVEVGELLAGDGNELLIRIHPLAEGLGENRQPRARWRTRIVEDGRLRWVRTAVAGRAPGFAPGPPVAGPWRPIVLERHGAFVPDEVRVVPSLAGRVGSLDVRVAGRTPGSDGAVTAELRAEGPDGAYAAPLGAHREEGGVRIEGRMEIPDVARWWPHTHGDPARYRLRLHVDFGGDPLELDLGHTGFRTLEATGSEGLALAVNGLPIFARGALWTPMDLSPADAVPDLRGALRQVVEAGMNMLRIPGTAAYETRAFHDACDELGILVWQDLMFANMDYPFADPDFSRMADAEADAVVARLAGHPSTAVVCGNSEVEQQVGMLGLDPTLAHAEFYDAALARRAAAAGLDAIVVPSSPTGGDQPFRTNRGVAHYYGVGGYRRPLADVRLADVRFAAECLAIANLPEGGPASGGAPEAGVPRDIGASWDFADVRDHYLAAWYGVDPAELRAGDPERYGELSRVVSGEVMAAVLGELRRPGSPCAGALVNCLHDLRPGSGWGIVDAGGTPKPAYWAVRRALAPLAVWMTDEGLNGIAVHVANDRPVAFAGELRIRAFRDRAVEVATAVRPLALAPHAAASYDAEELFGRFLDIGWAYRFGPPTIDLVAATLAGGDGPAGRPVSSAVHHPLGRPAVREPVDRLGPRVVLEAAPGGVVRAAIEVDRHLHGARLQAPGYAAADAWFSVVPGEARMVDLHPDGPASAWRGGSLVAVNLEGGLRLDGAPHP